MRIDSTAAHPGAARVLAGAALLLASAALPLAAQTAVPSPAEHLGFDPGTDRRLADYHQIHAWFETLAETSDRVLFSSIGTTTEGHPMGLAVISSAANLANLDAIRTTNLALADPRKLKPGAAEELIARGKTIVNLNASIHSNEVGPTQATLPLAHFLATTQDPAWLQVLDDVVLLMLPCHNPDGYLKQVDWYRRWVGTPHEGCPLPGLYHPYAGHDNNRDWFMFNLRETRLTVKEIHLRWAPQIVIDAHQMMEVGPRLFTPPYMDPVEPNVDPILVERLNELGLSVQKDLLDQGLRGVVNRTIFDAWSPSRAYMHYHGGVRFLLEIAACRQASPVERKGLDGRFAAKSEINPAPWGGDRWALSDVVRYHNEAAKSVLRHASRHRERWLRGFHEVFRKACSATDGPEAIELIQPRGQRGEKLLDVLAMGGVECSIDSNSELGSLSSRLDRYVVIRRNQPFFGFARALLTTTPYPRSNGSGSVGRPYDVTAHSLKLLLDVDEGPRGARFWRGLGHGRLAPKVDFEPGHPSSEDGDHEFFAQPPRGAIGVYRTHVTNAMDEGWTRLFLDLSKTPYRMLENADLRSKETANGLRVLIFPSMTADMIINGNRDELFPPEYRGGIGDAGVAWLDAFVRNGGTLIGLNEASALPIQVFRLPIRNALTTPGDERVFIPGAILRMDLDPEHPWQRDGLFSMDFGFGLQGKSFPAMFFNSKAFEADASPEKEQRLKPVVIARWAPVDSLLMGGHAEGLGEIAGKPAIVQCAVGKGRVILFGFPPQFRCQTWATFPLLRAAIAIGLEERR